MPDPAEAIKSEIKRHGPVTFARFMEMALYGLGGYYTSGSPISASGDYFTAPSAHPAFGALIAVQLRQMWRLLGSPRKFTVVEPGASGGGLAADITEFSERLDTVFSGALDYRAFDIAPSPMRQFPVSTLSDIPQGITGCVLSNELLDAMPVHIFEKRDGALKEVLVALDGEDFVEALNEPTTPEIARRIAPLLASLPDGYRGEVNIALEGWAAGVAKTLGRGWALTIDYGFDRAELYRPERVTGSLRCYHQHTLSQDPLRHAGGQDITAHVDFTALDEAMSRAGLKNIGHTAQADFLERLGVGRMRESLRNTRLPRPGARANEAGIEALMDHAGMGGFRVVAHGKGVDGLELRGVPSAVEAPVDIELPPTPLLKPGRHINLLSGMQRQQGYFEMESLEDLFRD
jgi:SAM-dependent MidA family methyltransferase